MKRGFTLTEILVAITVFTLITALIAVVAILSLRSIKVSQNISQVQRELGQCMQGVIKEISRSHTQTYQSPAAVNQTWFLSNRPPETQTAPIVFDQSNGQVLWQKWVAIWCTADGTVFKAEKALSGGACIFNDLDWSSQPTALTDFTALPKPKRLATTIQRLQISLDESLVTIELDSKIGTSGNPLTKYHMTSSFFVP